MCPPWGTPLVSPWRISCTPRCPSVPTISGGPYPPCVPLLCVSLLPSVRTLAAAPLQCRRFSPAANSLPESRAPHFGSSIMPYSAFSVVRKAVRAMFGRAPGHAWVEPETENRARGLPPCQDRPEKISDPGCGMCGDGPPFQPTIVQTLRIFSGQKSGRAHVRRGARTRVA